MVEFEDESIVSGEVTIEARARISDFEVEASDIDGYDAEQALSDAINSYNVTVYDAELTIDDSPPGFEAVESALGRDTAIEVYSILATGGYEVN